MQQPQVTPERIMQMAWGYAPPLILEAALRHRVFDVLEKSPMTVEEVEAATGASARGLAAILNALTGLGFLEKRSGRYELTEESAAYLVSTKAGFMGGLILHTSQQLIPKWLHLNHIVATGRPAAAVNQEQTGGDFFHRFVEDIFPVSYPAAQHLASALEVSRAQAPISVLDLAAGSGVWGIAFAQASPKVHVTAVDWPEVLPVTRKVVSRFGVSDRFRFSGGDLREADFGSGHNIATLGHILHSEGEERSRKLLRRTFEAMAPGGTIAIAEFLVNDERTAPVNALIFAVNMLVNTDQGGTWSYNEISGWLADAGFVYPRQLEAPGPSPLILATRP